jgi:hypothetical protein
VLLRDGVPDYFYRQEGVTGTMHYHLFLLVLMTVLVTAGCIEETYDTVTPVPKTTLPLATPVKTLPVITIQTPVTATLPVAERSITEGFWCRDTTMNIGKAPTVVRECYQFFADGTYKWGYSPGQALGKSSSCSGDPRVQCAYSLNANGRYEVEGGYFYTRAGNALIDPHDPPYFIWTATGIP